MTDTAPPNVKRTAKVIAGRANPFGNVNGGRSGYGALIMKALTGLDQDALLDRVQGHLSDADVTQLRKDIAQNGEVFATLLDAEDQFFLDYMKIQGGVSLIAPPIAPERLARLVVESNSLEPCISTMVTNIACTGFDIVPVKGTDADLTEADKTEREHIEEFLAEVFPRKSFLRTRKELRRDLQETGNSYMVIERNALGELAFIRRAPAKSMRIVKLDEPTTVKVRMKRKGADIELTTMRAERRYAQKIGTKLVYYKEYGSSRDLNRTTGEWAKEGESLLPQQRAHEVIHDRDLEDVYSPYGLPRWITQLPSVLGSRMAEEHNLAYFQSGGVPPVMVFITGGSVTEEVQQALDAFFSGKASDKQRGVAFEIPSAGDINDERPASVQVERFGANDADSTFENYDEKCELRVRKAFRIPGIFLGMADAYNRATADAAYAVGEAQVFAPERDEEDEKYNMTIMREIDTTGLFKFVSRPLTVKDVMLQLRGLEMLKGIEGVSVSDWVDTVADTVDVTVTLSEDFKDTVFTNPTAAAPRDPQAPSTDAVDNVTPPGENPPQEPAQPPEAVSNRAAQTIAASIARSIRDYEDDGDADCLRKVLACEKAYAGLDEPSKVMVDKMLAPLLYSSPFVGEAAMADVAGAYAVSIFRDARTKLDEMETRQ